ncbi:MAG: primosomal protein N' [bacterium]|nr:primosomal protein N' [bacterium]
MGVATDSTTVVGKPRFAQVAVPVPLAEALTYAVPRDFPDIEPGFRVKVPVGRRQLVGVVLALLDEAPTGFEIREILEVLDVEPLLSAELLDLARFTADYYLAPIGETLRAMIPRDLPPWGNRRVSLTDAGALAQARSPEEKQLVELLLARPRSRLAELQRYSGIPRLARLVDDLRRRGRITVEEPERRGTRYVKAVELRPGDLEQQLEACGRSPLGRAVVEYLSAAGRPATLREITGAVGCGNGVIRRLASLDLLREFTQPERLSLDRHRLGGGSRDAPLVLRDDQKTAVEALRAAIHGGRFAPFLLRGITGAGKTEVYLQAVDECLRVERSAIILVPEIALVPALAGICRRRYGSELAILHSNLGSAERHQEWERLRRGEARVVLGPRSALWSPVSNLGLVVVDEEHDSSYKQDKTPRYNGRDLGLVRARSHDATALLVSATPSLESRRNQELGKLGGLELTTRVGQGELPEGILVDLRREKVRLRPGEVHYSHRLRSEIEAAVGAGDQVILLRNRRGYAPLLLCRACGENFTCEDCGLPLTFHRREGRLLCHYCNHSRPKPTVCPSCGEQALEPIGAGTERVEEQFTELFPGVTVDVLDADAARRTGGSAAVLQSFSSGRTQVLIGTQMVAKGHHFPCVSLAAVLFADTYLSFPDFRSVERTYALLTQLAGRAGRGERPGKVVIQSFHPEHYAIRAALENDDETFLHEEMRFRRTFHYPPFTRMIQLLAQHQKRERVERGLRETAARLLEHPLAADVRVTGPAPAPLEKLRGKWRFQLLLRGVSGARLRRLVREALAEHPNPDVTVDVDPYDLM